MNERLMFRAWDEENERMVYSNAMPNGYFVGLNKNGELGFGRLCKPPGPCVVDLPGPIMQCTGLRDKYSKLIWQHDICEGKDRTRLTLAKNRELFTIHHGLEPEVHWCQSTGFWHVSVDTVPDRVDALKMEERHTCDLLNELYSRHLRVVGNIHENPELLEDGA